MSNSVLVIGNGFDLAHGRKTQYMDFIKCIVESIEFPKENKSGVEMIEAFPNCKKSSLLNLLIHEYKNEFVIENWIDFETELHELIIRLNPFLDSFRIHRRDMTYRLSLSDVKHEDSLLPSSLKSVLTLEDRIIKIQPEFIDVWGRIDKHRVFVQIEKELTELSKMFEYYLIHIEPSLRGEMNQISVVRDMNPCYVISFNYTDTYESLYELPTDNVCYIHGKIRENNIVFGYTDDAEEYTEDLMFKKYYRRLINHTDTIDHSKFYRWDSGIPVNHSLYIYGHSLSISDKDILLDLLSSFHSVCIYCRNEFERAQRIGNLIQIIGKEKTVSRIQNGEIVFEFLNENP